MSAYPYPTGYEHVNDASLTELAWQLMSDVDSVTRTVELGYGKHFPVLFALMETLAYANQMVTEEASRRAAVEAYLDEGGQ